MLIVVNSIMLPERLFRGSLEADHEADKTKCAQGMDLLLTPTWLFQRVLVGFCQGHG